MLCVSSQLYGTVCWVPGVTFWYFWKLWKVSDVQNLVQVEGRRAWSLNPFTEVFVPLQKLENGLLGVWGVHLRSELVGSFQRQTWFETKIRDQNLKSKVNVCVSSDVCSYFASFLSFTEPEH